MTPAEFWLLLFDDRHQPPIKGRTLSDDDYDRLAAKLDD
jgi:hypothetical protein